MTDLKKFFNDLTSVSIESWDKFSVLFEPGILKKGDYFITDGQSSFDSRAANRFKAN